jgi:acetyltransferase-like isoleucine patch superfamily enzyme
MSSIAYRIVRKFVLQPWQRWQTDCQVIEQLERLANLGVGVAVNGPIRLGNTGDTWIAEDVSINSGLIVRGEGRLTIGPHCHFGEDVLILTANHNYDRPTRLPYDKTRISKEVRIGAAVWICDRVIITPGVTIGEGAVLAAGSVVTRDVPPLTVVGGAPAAPLRMRNEETYRRLTAERQYLGWPRDYDLVNGRKTRIRRSSARHE